MASKRRKYPQFTTKPAPVLFAWLDKPSTKFKKEGGKYDVTVLLTKEEADEIKEWLKPIFAEAKKEFLEDPKAKKKNNEGVLRKDYKISLPVTPQRDEEGEETGMYQFKASMNAQYTKEDGEVLNFTVPIFDAKKNPIKPKVGRGSKVRVNFEACPFVMDATSKMGISARLKAVQIIDLVEYSGGGADAFGFGVEDGFESDGSDEKPKAEKASDSDDDSPF